MCRTYHGTFDTMIMPTVGIGKDTILVLQTTISPDRRILNGSKRATKFGLERPRYLCEKLHEQCCLAAGLLVENVREGLDDALNIVVDDEERGKEL